MQFENGAKIRHIRHGIGTVKYDDGETVGIRFEHGLEECDKNDIESIQSIADGDHPARLPNTPEVLARTQAEAIQSINDTWGIFSLSRIDLLPHQLWVCKRVTERLPARWLIADDVGLGKTIEAGLILWPLISRKKVRRVLILCPASLVAQWTARMKQMFDLNFNPYHPEFDTPKLDYWNIQTQVVGSLQTLRKNHNGRHQRMIESDPWDLVIVDEAHHINAEEHTGQTLGYKLIDKLQAHGRIRSMIFFTGTPHRGKNFGFLSLLHLLRPDIFSPEKSLSEQLKHLSHAMIRNNKQNVTDLKGNRIFFPPKVRSHTYEYSPEETDFYETLTRFILGGKAYASTLTQKAGKTVVLVLIAMQKLASSSVAAIRRALKNRLAKLSAEKTAVEEKAANILKTYQEAQQDETTDYAAEVEEQLAEYTDRTTKLMADEADKLQELIQKADAVVQETKIHKIIERVEADYQDRSILFFTEYKATQSLLISELMKRFGDHCATFINGDNAAANVTTPDGREITLRETRDNAADRFNSGEVRFLVSTEAAGEGVDLQESCHTLVHVDLPWNPMRMHQRVGRLNRYGQKKQVEVVSMRNPNTVESLIWEKLDIKLREIMTAFGAVMDEPEDLMQLVLGMSDPNIFNELHFQSITRQESAEQLTQWFDQKTRTFAGEDVVDAVKAIVGNSDRFDYQQVAAHLPDMDLPDLRPFFKSMLRLNGRQVSENEDRSAVAFITPEKWREKDPILYARYDAVFFSRKVKKNAGPVLGLGHRLMDQAIRQAKVFFGDIAFLPKQSLKAPAFVFKITDKQTDQDVQIRKRIAGVSHDPDAPNNPCLLKDSDILKWLNGIRPKQHASEFPTAFNMTAFNHAIETSEAFLMDRLETLDLPFHFPQADLICAFWPIPETKRPVSSAPARQGAAP